MLTAHDSYSSLTLLNNTNASFNQLNSSSNISHDGQQQLYTEQSFDESLPTQSQNFAVNVTTSTSTRFQKNFDNVYTNMTIVDDDDDETEDDDVHVSTKVRRCFGNTMCMPQNLLCFKVWLLF